MQRRSSNVLEHKCNVTLHLFNQLKKQETFPVRGEISAGLEMNGNSWQHSH